MPDFKLVHKEELDELTAALKTHGWHNEGFTVEGEEYDPAKAEVESEAGQLITRTHRVRVYHLGRGFSWVAISWAISRPASSANRRKLNR